MFEYFFCKTLKASCEILLVLLLMMLTSTPVTSANHLRLYLYTSLPVRVNVVIMFLVVWL